MEKLIVFLFISFVTYAVGQDNFERKKAEEAYKNNDYQKSASILNGLQNKNYIDLYNQANNQYKLGNYDKALELYQQIPSNELNTNQAYKVNHNKGNCQVQLKKYQEAIQSYGQALQNNPNSESTKYNLNYARKKIIQQQQQQQQQQQNKQKQEEDKKKQEGDKQEQKDKQEGDKQEGDKQEQEDKQDQKDKQEGDKQEQEDKQEGDKQEQNGGADDMTKEDAEKLLDAFARENKKVQEEADETKNKKKSNKNVDKDW